MAEPRRKRPAAQPPADARPVKAAGATPPPPERLHLSIVTLPKGQVLHRVHLVRHEAAQFNPGIQGNARFSPIRDHGDQPVPTLYAGTTFDCALMETVLHDVPHVAGFKSLDKGKLAGQVHSVLETTRELQLADLGSVALRKLGVQRKQLIDTEKDQYPRTRQWAQAIHHQHPKIQGLSWVSRQDDSARAFVLFGDRITGVVLRQQSASRELTQDADAYAGVLLLAERIGVEIVPGRA